MRVPKAPQLPEKKIDEMYEEALSKKLQEKVDALNEEREALRASEEKYRQLIESLQKDFFFYSHDTKGVFTYISPSITNILGYTEKEFLTYYTKYLTDSPNNKEVVTKTALSLQGKEQPPYEVEIRHKNGSVRCLDVKEVPVLDANGKVIAVDGVARDITERKRTEDELREKRKYLAKTEEISLLMPTHVGLDGRWLKVPNRLCQLLGYTREELLNQKFKSVTHPDDFMADWNQCQRLINGEIKSFDLEKRYIRKDGQIVWVDINCSVVENSDGKPLYFVTYIRDISDRKQAEEKLRQSEVIVANTSDMLALLDKDYTYLAANPAYLKAFGKTSEQLIGHTASEVFGKEFFNSVIKPNADRCLSGEEVNYQNWFVFPVTGKAYMDISYYPYIGDDNKIIGFIVNKRNITERQKAQEKIQKLSMGIEQSPTSIVITDANGTIEYVNPFFCQQTGYSPAEVIGKNPRILKSGEMSAEDYKVLWETILAGKIWRGEFHNKMKNGELYWESAVISPILIDEKVTHFISIKEDITEKKKKEEILKSVQKQLVVSQKLAGIGGLAAGVSHEVLNPVNIISVHTQMLQKKTPDDPTIQNFCSKVRNEIERITKIMGTLLVFSRKGESKYENTVVKELIDEVITLVSKDFALDNIALEISFCKPYAEISADKDKMRQVFLNLIYNARHAMPEGGKITFNCHRKKSRGLDIVEILMSDTGVGIKKENLDKIFDPFFTTKPEGQGTGMGLSVVHGIIEDHDGNIAVKSKEGKGTTFIISLPIVN